VKAAVVWLHPIDVDGDRAKSSVRKEVTSVHVSGLLGEKLTGRLVVVVSGTLILSVGSGKSGRDGFLSRLAVEIQCKMRLERVCLSATASLRG